MIARSESSVPACLCNAIDDEPCMLKDEGLMSMQCDNGKANPTIRATSYKQHEPPTIAWTNTKQWKRWRKISRPNGEKSSRYQTLYCIMEVDFKISRAIPKHARWGHRVNQSDTVPHHTRRIAQLPHLICSLLYRLKGKGGPKQEVFPMLVVGVVRIAQPGIASPVVSMPG